MDPTPGAWQLTLGEDFAETRMMDSAGEKRSGDRKSWLESKATSPMCCLMRLAGLGGWCC